MHAHFFKSSNVILVHLTDWQCTNHIPMLDEFFWDHKTDKTTYNQYRYIPSTKHYKTLSFQIIVPSLLFSWSLSPSVSLSLSRPVSQKTSDQGMIHFDTYQHIPADRSDSNETTGTGAGSLWLRKLRLLQNQCSRRHQVQLLISGWLWIQIHAI